MLSLLSEAEPFDNICVNWEWIGDRAAYEWQDKLITQRFDAGVIHPKKKCIFKPHAVYSLYQIHFPEMIEGSRSVDCSGFVAEDITVDALPRGEPQILLRHYFAKSFQEFCLKMLRGRGAVGKNIDPRSYDKFMWGLQNLKHTPYPQHLRPAFERSLNQLRTIDGLEKIEDSITSESRRRIAEMEANHDLISKFRDITS